MSLKTIWPRVRGLILFVAIVWSIALAFLLVEKGSQQLLDWSLRSGLMPAELGMPRASQDHLAACTARLQASGEPDTPTKDSGSIRQARLIAWKMGYGFGFTVGLGEAGALTESQRTESLSTIEPISQALHIPAPVPPPFGPSVTALPDYGQLVEDDPSCTAAVLERRYGAPVGHVYRLGAVVGFAVVYRTLCPQCGALYVPQIRHHAREASLPEVLWHPFTQPPPDGLTSDARQAEVLAMARRIEQALEEKTDVGQ